LRGALGFLFGVLQIRFVSFQLVEIQDCCTKEALEQLQLGKLKEDEHQEKTRTSSARGRFMFQQVVKDVGE